MNNLLTINKMSDAHSSDFIKNIRDSIGVACTKCGSKEVYWLNSKQMYQCKCCEFRMSIKHGTVMQSSKLSIKTWLLAIYYISRSAKSITAIKMQELLGLGCYETALRLMHKIRNCMSQSEIETISEGLDEYIRTKFNVSSRSKKKKKEPADLLIKNQRDENGKYRISLIYIPDLQKHKPNRNSKVSMARSHPWDSAVGYRKEFTPYKELSYWQRIFLTNTERNINGIHHGVSDKYRQGYVDEFCFRTNMRMAKKNIFEELLVRVLTKVWWA
jgi:transposase-like protein